MERFKDRVAQNPQRRKMRIIGTSGFEECVVDILRDDNLEGVETQNGVLQTGTPLNAGSLNAILDEIDITAKIWQETGTAVNRVINIPGTASWDNLLNKLIYIKSVADGSSANTFLALSGIAKQLSFPSYLMNGSIPKSGWIKAGEIYSIVWNGSMLRVTNVLSEAQQASGDLSEVMQKIDITAKVWTELAGSTSTSRSITIPGIAGWSDLTNKRIWIKARSGGAAAVCSLKINNVARAIYTYPKYMMDGSFAKTGWVKNGEIYEVFYDGTRLHLTNVFSTDRNVENELSPVISQTEGNGGSKPLRLELIPESGFLRLAGYTKGFSGKEIISFNLKIPSEALQIETNSKIAIFIEPGLEDNVEVTSLKNFLEEKEIEVETFEMPATFNEFGGSAVMLNDDGCKTILVCLSSDPYFRIPLFEMDSFLTSAQRPEGFLTDMMIYEIFPSRESGYSSSQIIENPYDSYYYDYAYNCGAADIIDWGGAENVISHAIGRYDYESIYDQSGIMSEFYLGKSGNTNLETNGLLIEEYRSTAINMMIYEIYNAMISGNTDFHILVFGTEGYLEIFECINNFLMEADFVNFTVEFLNLTEQADTDLLAYINSGDCPVQTAVYTIEKDYEHMYNCIEAIRRGEAVDDVYRPKIKIYK